MAMDFTPGPEPEDDAPPAFPHPPWMVGVVLVFGVVSIVAGLREPIWLVVGSPFIAALGFYVWARLHRRRS